MESDLRQRITRPTVVDVAITLADQGGPEAISLSAVAQVLGCTSPSLYSHVQSVRDLMEAVSTRCTHEFADQLRDAVMGRSDEEGIRAFAGAWREYARTYPSRYAAVLRPSGGQEEERKQAAAHAIRAGESVLLSLGVEQQDLAVASIVFRSILQGFSQIEKEIDAGALTVDQADETFGYLMEILIGGIRRRVRSELDGPVAQDVA